MTPRASVGKEKTRDKRTVVSTVNIDFKANVNYVNNMSDLHMKLICAAYVLLYNIV